MSVQAGGRSTEDLASVAIGDAGALEAVLVPHAGMVCRSLRHEGEELLGQRDGLAGYVESRRTFGVPLLYPWANRLARRRFPLAGREVAIDPVETPTRLDEHGLPMHGLLAAAPGWTVERHDATDDGGALEARFAFTDPPLVAAFPFPHEVRMEARVTGTTLRIATTVIASAGSPVPVAFGFHPYLRLPGVPRADWHVELPVRERLDLDERMLPTGVRRPVLPWRAPLGAQTFDDAYVAPPGAAPFVLAGGRRRVELSFDGGFRFAQVYAPSDDDVIAFEPMVAPTNALVSAGPELPMLAPGERYATAFSISITRPA